MSDRNEIVSRVTAALEGKPAPVAIRNARKVDARGERRGYWVVSDAAGVIVAAGTGEETFEHYCRTVGLDPADRNAVIDAEGRILTPGYVDIHAHGAWEKSFDDGPDGIDVARAGHAVHGTTRQVLSLIDQPRGRDLPQHPHRPRHNGVRPPRHPRLPSGRPVPGPGPQGRT